MKFSVKKVWSAISNIELNLYLVKSSDIIAELFIDAR